MVEAPRSGVAGGVGTETAPLEGVSSVRTEEEDPTLCKHAFFPYLEL